MKPNSNEMLGAQRGKKFQGQGPNWILIAGGALLSTLSVRLGYRLKQVLDLRQPQNTNDGLKGLFFCPEAASLGAAAICPDHPILSVPARCVIRSLRSSIALAVKEAAWGLARYAGISQDNGLVPIVEPEIFPDGDHSIDTTLEVAEKVWSEVFYYLAENNVMFEEILLKPSKVTPGADQKENADPETIIFAWIKTGRFSLGRLSVKISTG